MALLAMCSGLPLDGRPRDALAAEPLRDHLLLTLAAPGPNNIVGVNLARRKQPDYIRAASDLANANGGAWGYVTVVWTAAERDAPRSGYILQEFLDRCYEARLQPIVRVSTRFDEDTGIWDKPTMDDPALWRAFLEKGRWPARRVWVIPANEPNLGREWGGAVDGGDYARYLGRFLDAFEGSDRFKVVNAPLDASNGTEQPKMQDAYEFLTDMERAVPSVFERLGAWALGRRTRTASSPAATTSATRTALTRPSSRSSGGTCRF